MIATDQWTVHQGSSFGQTIQVDASDIGAGNLVGCSARGELSTDLRGDVNNSRVATVKCVVVDTYANLIRCSIDHGQTTPITVDDGRFNVEVVTSDGLVHRVREGPWRLSKDTT